MNGKRIAPAFSHQKLNTFFTGMNPVFFNVKCQYRA